ncbi:DUF4124 domain-containing protein [Bradyrhizobium sp.]|uniref:DUF4124 domain-containing protein n=1 Tax=Bradyrhizobium sp. TaxID=376 RepID=UPI003D0E55B2
MHRIALLLAALAFAAVAHAQQFRWVDKNGKVQYGDVPPPGVKATPLRAPAGPPSPPPAAAAKDGAAKGAEKALTPEEAFRKRQEDQKKAAAKAAAAEREAAEKKENCARAQGQLRDLESGMRIARSNEKGERVFMDDAQRARETEAARKSVAEWCK